MKYTITKTACYISGFIQAVNISFLPLLFVNFNENYGISYESLGALVVFSFVLQLGVDLISVPLLRLIGYRVAALFGNILSAIGFIMLAILQKCMDSTYLAVILSTVVYSLGSGLIEVIMSPIIEYLPTRNKAAQMSLLHSFFCIGQVLTVVITTLFFVVFGRENWQYIALIWAALGIVNALLFTKSPIIDPEKTKHSFSKKEILLSPVFYAVMFLMFAAGASEIAISQWASAFAEAGLGLSKTLGDLLGPCAFAVFMATGRLLYAVIGRKVKIEIAVLVFGTMLFGCYILLFLSESPVLSLIACALSGLFVSIMWPGSLSIGAKHFTGGGTLLFGLAAAFGDIGCAIGPYIMGFMTERSTMQSGFLVCSIFPLIIVICALYFLKYSCNIQKNMLK